MSSAMTRPPPGNGPAAGYKEGTGKTGFYSPLTPGWTSGTYDQADPSPAFRLNAGKAVLLNKVEFLAFGTPVTNFYNGYTTDESRVPLTSAEDIVDVTVNGTGTTRIWHAVSFDNRETFWVYDPVSGGWTSIVQLSGSQWQFKNAGETFEDASSNSLISALRGAFTTYGMTTAELEAAVSWEDAGFVELFTQHMDFAFCLQKNASVNPVLSGYTVTTKHTGLAQIDGWQGSSGWQAGVGWTDGTAIGGTPLAQDGAVIYDGTSPFEAEYSVINGVPAYWYRLTLLQGTSSTCAINRIRYKAPCQELANVGDGLERICAGLWYNNTDYTPEAATPVYTDNSCVWLCDDWTASTITPMGTSDGIWVLSPLPFNQLRIKMHPQHPNKEAATLSAYYYSSSGEWASINITDGTAISGATLAADGTISWTLPSDWDEIGSLSDRSYARGYWMWFKVSTDLTAPCGVVEARLYDIPKSLHKHRHVASVWNRLFLASRPDAPDQVQASLELKEHGWHGNDTHSARVGGMDAITGIFSANNSLYVAKPNSLYTLRRDFSFGVLQVTEPPLNSRVVVTAPSPGARDSNKEALYWLNHRGAHLYTGLQADLSYASGQWRKISDTVDWWTRSALPRIDLNYIHQACGVYYARENWVVWAVPMTTDGSAQSTNNRLIIYDVTHGAWLPPFDIGLASICSGYYYNSNAPGKLGQLGLFGGNYYGQVVELFSATDDAGTEISAYAETGWLDFGAPEIEKNLRALTVLGNTEAVSNNVVVKVYKNGIINAYNTLTYSGCDEESGVLAHYDFKGTNIHARFFKFRIETAGPTEIHSIFVELHSLRGWPDAD